MFVETAAHWAADPVIEAAYCKDGEKLLGWISMGAPKGPRKHVGKSIPR